MLTDQAPLLKVADSWVKALLKVMVEGGRLTGLPLATVIVPPSMKKDADPTFVSCAAPVPLGLK